MSQFSPKDLIPYLPKTLNQWLGTTAAFSLVVGWLAGLWMFGVAVAICLLCAICVRSFKAMPQADDEPDVSDSKPAPSPAPVKRPKRDDENLSLVERMISQGRVALLLRPQIAASLSELELKKAQDALDEAMAMVPEGQVAVRGRCYDNLEDEAAARAERLIRVEGLFLDRFPVTNLQFYEFVEAGGYEQMSLWDEAIWPAVLGFTDQSGQPGPRYWENGTYHYGKDDHPVVGVSWYEACAYARWAGKRLPTDPEWVKAGSWPVFAGSAKPVQRRYPWGDAMDRKRANIWGSGHDGTVSVKALPAGASASGVEQLIGNVWEWTSSSFGAWEPAGKKIETTRPLKSIRGGAFDTYFDTQSHCQFQSGDGPLSRKHNIGFRCALGFCDVVHMNGADEASPTEQEKAPEREEVLA